MRGYLCLSVQLGVFSGQFFPVFIPNAGKYGPDRTQYLHSLYAVLGPSQ